MADRQMAFDIAEARSIAEAAGKAGEVQEVLLRGLVLLISVGSLALCLAQCVPPGYSSEIISGDTQQVAIKAGGYANPGPTASEHCAKFGRTAVLQDAGGGIYKFTCQPSR
jgi:hypothetical protein